MGRSRPKMERIIAKSLENGPLLYNRPERNPPAGRLQIGFSFIEMEWLAMRVYQLRFWVRSAALAAAIGALAAPAFAQTDHSLALSAQTAVAQVATQPDQTGPVRRLSIEDATKLALEQNLGIRIQRLDPQIEDLSLAQARAAWAPTLTTQFNRNSATTQSTNTFSATNNAGTISNGIGLNQTLPTGGSYVVN